MSLTLSVDEPVAARARQRAEAMGKSLNQMVREYLEQLAGSGNAEADIREFERLSSKAKGNRREWKFDRDEIHQRR